MAAIVEELRRIPMSQRLVTTLATAAEVAHAQHHAAVSLEHLLLALADDQDAIQVLGASHVDTALLKLDVSQFLSGAPVSPHATPVEQLQIAPDLRRILEAAAAAAAQGRRREINGAIVLAAIVGDGKSSAAHMLRAQGLTFEEAIRALQRALTAQQPADAEDVLATARARVQNRSMPGLQPKVEPERQEAPAREEAPVPVENLALPGANDQQREVVVEKPASVPQSRTRTEPADFRAAVSAELSDARDHLEAGGAPLRPETSGERNTAAADGGAFNPSHQPPPELPTQTDYSFSPRDYREPPANFEQQLNRSDIPDRAAPASFDSVTVPWPSETTAPLPPGDLGHFKDVPAELRPLPPVPRQDHGADYQPDYAPGYPSEPPPVPPSQLREATGTTETVDTEHLRRAAQVRGAASRWPAPVGPAWQQSPPPPLPPVLPPEYEPTSAGANLETTPWPEQTYAPELEPQHQYAPPPAAMDQVFGQSASVGAAPYPDPFAEPASGGYDTPANSPPPFPSAENSAPGSARPPVPFPAPSPSMETDRAEPTLESGHRRVPIDKATAGQLVENIPRRMRTHIPAEVVVRIAGAESRSILDSLGGDHHRHDMLVAPAMSVKLRAPDGGFIIESASRETQWIDGIDGSQDYAQWRWTVTPQKSGRQRLQLLISTRTVDRSGLAADTMLPDQIVEIRVGVNYARNFMRVASWATIAAAGGLAARFGDKIYEPVVAQVMTLIR